MSIARARTPPAVDDVAGRPRKLAGDSGNPTADLASLALADAKLTEAGAAAHTKRFRPGRGYHQLQRAICSSIPTIRPMRCYILAQAREGQAQSKDDPTPGRMPPSPSCASSPTSRTPPALPHVANSLLDTPRDPREPLESAAKALRMYQERLKPSFHRLAPPRRRPGRSPGSKPRVSSQTKIS